MKFILPFLLLSIFLSIPAIAQEFSLEGSIRDENKEPLPGAYVSLQYPWGEVVKATVSEIDGSFLLNELEKGGYKIEVSFLGFQTLSQELTIDQLKQNIGILTLKEGALELEQVEVKDKIPLATQNGDTTDYNATAYKVLPDANAEDLIRKMPGVVIQNGKVQAQGEDVKEVLVDGRPFFGNDPNAALKNLPAEIISKIQIFDQKSDQSNFTGFEDGETSKVINIITKVDMSNGQFGKLYAGYGPDNKYQAGGSTNFFDGDRRISIIAQSNNINIQNFAAEDLLGVVGGSGDRGGRRGGGRRGGGSRGGGSSVNDFLVEQQGGIAETHALGLNYSDQWGKKWEVNGSYFFNLTDNVAEESISQDFINTEQSYLENNSSTTRNINHRLNGRLTYTINERNSLVIRPSLSIQQNDGNSYTLGQTLSAEQGASNTRNEYRTDLTGINFDNNLLWRHKFEKRRRSLSVNARTQYTNNAGNNNLLSENIYDQNPQQNDTLDQFSELDVNGWELSSNISFTEPVGERNMLMLSYRNSLNLNDSDKQTFDFSENSQDYTDLNESLSNVFESRFMTHQLGAGINIMKSRDFFMMFRANVQYAELTSEEVYPLPNRVKEEYYHVLPFAMVRLNFSKQENLRIFYRSNLDVPSVEQLQNVLDNSNPLQLSIGNPELNPAYSHRVFARYSRTNTEKSTVFYTLLSTSYTANYISNATYFKETDAPVFEDIDLPRGAQLTQPVNLDGYWNMRAFITYGLPFRPIKSNLNFDLGTTYARTPGLIDDQENISNSIAHALGLTISSNISDKLDFSLSTRFNINDVKNSLQTEANNQYWQQNSSARLNWILPAGIVFRSSIEYQFYEGLDDATDTNYWLWNASIGKKLFKNELGEIALVGFDLLDQNQSINRNVTQTYIEEVQTNILQRYFLLKFTYNFRNFNSGKVKTEKESEWEKRRKEMFGG